MPNLHRTLGSIPSNTQTACLTSEISALRNKDNGQKFKVILSYTVVTFRAVKGCFRGGEVQRKREAE